MRTTLKAVINEKLPSPMDLGQPMIQNFDNVAEILELVEDDLR